MPLLLPATVFLLSCIVVIRSDNFPSLLTTNATIAIIIDREFMAENYLKTKTAIESYLIYANREILKNGGLNVQYYSWTSVNLRRDFTALLSVTSCAETWKLFKAAESEHLLHMAISESDCPRLPANQAITIPLITNGQELSQILLDLRTFKLYNWTSAVILYDHTLDRDMISRVVKSVSLGTGNIRADATAISLLKLGNYKSENELRKTLSDIFLTIIKKRTTENFIVIAAFETIEIIMELAKINNLVNIKTQWLYIISNTDYRDVNNINLFQKLLYEGDNIAFLYNSTMQSDSCKTGIICHCEEVLESFIRALNDAIKNEISIASQVSDEEWEAIRPTKLERRDFVLQNVKSNLLNYGICDNCTFWLMKTGITWGKGYQDRSPELISVGSWRASDGPLMSDELFPHNAHKFRRLSLSFISFHNPPWQIIKTNESGDIVEYKGLVFDIINELSRALNFTYTVNVIKIDSPLIHSNSNISEINQIMTNKIPQTVIDMVRNKTVMMAACAFTVSEKYKSLVNFTGSINTQSYTFLVTRPKELSRALLFISPFSADTWLCLAAAIVSMGPILYYIHRYSPFYQYYGIRMKGGLSSIGNCIWYMYGALLQQGGMHLPQADSARIIVGAWWLVVLVISTTYCGNLVAFLTFPKMDIAIRSISDLIEHRDKITWSMPKGSYLEEQLRLSPQVALKMLYKGRKEVKDGNYLIGSIIEGKHVYIDWKIKLQYIMKKEYLQTNRCKLTLGMDEFLNEELAFILSQDSPYLEMVNAQIKRLHQVGLIEKWLKAYLPKKDRCWKTTHLIEVNNHTVNMNDMQGSFFVLFLGFTVSFLIILIEKLWNKYKTKKKKKVIQPFTS